MDSTDPLESGGRLGPYTILGRLGSGGMGDVYRGHDPKLTRDVAIKVVRSGLAGDPERLARFQREARILAALNHPHIAAIYGLEDSGGTPALVMELVEGPTLADRLRRGPIAVAEALRIAGQIADALEYAHERGIVHRDLKPGNVKVADDGTVKILDFGLAKALDVETAAPDQADASTVSRLATEAGAVMGTPAYMSPEQAAGRPVDRRTDIWAFGCVLYEMVTGRRAFRGESATEMLAAVIHAEPDWSALPAATPWEIRALLRHCLRKDLRKRLQAIGDARIAIEEALEGPPASEGADATPGPAPHTGRRLAFELAGAAVVAALAALAAWSFKPSAASPQPVRPFPLPLPPGQQLAGLDGGALSLSTDGNQLAYVATTKDGRQQIYIRAMDTGVTKPVAGSGGGTTPFFSPDGQWLGFFADGKLQKVPVKGGAVETLADTSRLFGASWSSRHTIVFAPLYSVIEEVPDEAGGTPHPLTQFEGSEISHTWPSALPDGAAVVFGSREATSGGIAVQDAAGGKHHFVARGADMVAARYVAGHLIYLQNGNLMAAPFEYPHDQTAGDAVLMVPDVRQYAVSASGSLAYVAGRGLVSRRRLVWVSLAGTPQVIDDRPVTYYQPRLEPVDDSRIAMDVTGMGQVWMFDFATHNLTPFTFGDLNQHAVWTRDGKELVFMTRKGQTWQLSAQAADGSGKPARLIADAGKLDIPYSVTPDGSLAFVKYGGAAGNDLWVMPLRGPASASSARRIFTIPTGDADAGAVFSPDGHWLAYAGTDGSGRRQIYVQAYPGPGGKHQVSIDGGNEPMWNPDTARQPLELFYRNGDDMMAVDITTHPAFALGNLHRLFSGANAYAPVIPNYVRANYDVSADGQRFLMLQKVEQKEPPITEIHVVLNWAEELKRLVPAKH